MLTQVDGDLGAALWRAFRNVRLWADTPPECRGRLFPPPSATARRRLEAAVERAPALAEPLGALAGMYYAATIIRPGELAALCMAVHDWAHGESLPLVAAFFATAAALADPEHPAPANAAGRACRRAGLLDDAAVWFERAFGLAKRARSRAEAARALLGYSLLLGDQGRHDEARVVHERAMRRVSDRLRPGREAEGGGAARIASDPQSGAPERLAPTLHPHDF